eukprot:355968-Chlamydomonas_euryale.AAC.1
MPHHDEGQSAPPGRLPGPSTLAPYGLVQGRHHEGKGRVLVGRCTPHQLVLACDVADMPLPVRLGVTTVGEWDSKGRPPPAGVPRSGLP